MTVRYTKRALADLERILTHIAESSPRGAANLAARIESVVRDLDGYPRSGRTTDRPNLRVRAVGNYPYLIFYRIAENGVVSIVHVRHGARRPFAR